MSSLLYKIQRNRLRARTLFNATLEVYEDYVVIKKRIWFNLHEVTISFNHIAQANIIKGPFFSTLEIVSSGGYENAAIKYVLNKHAKKAKSIIDQKIYRMHQKQDGKRKFEHHEDHQIEKFEKSLSRLKELQARGKISKKEFDQKRKRLLKRVN